MRLKLLGTGMHSDQRTNLNGTTFRWRKNTCTWSDRLPTADVQTFRASEPYHFRIRNRRWIEVFVQYAREKEALHWITRGRYEITLSGYHYGPIVIREDGLMTRASLNGKVIPEVYLVPIADWASHHQQPSPRPDQTS